MHFPIADTIRAFSQWPRFSEGLTLVLFPITAILNLLHFIIQMLFLSRTSEVKEKNMIALYREICYSIYTEYTILGGY